MTTNYKILGQGINSLSINAPENGSVILSKLKIRNTSYPTSVDAMIIDSNESIIYSSRVDSSYKPYGATGSEGNYPFVTAMKEDSNGDLITASRWNSDTDLRIYKVHPNGTLIGGFFISSSNSSVYSIDTQSDGKILIGGYLSNMQTITQPSQAYNTGILRINTDGTIDTTFNNTTLRTASNQVGLVNKVKVLPDGKILIGGQWATVNGVLRPNIARLNSDGTLDTTFSHSAGYTYDGCIDFDIQSDGKIIYSGPIYGTGGSSYLNRLNSNGSFDTSFLVRDVQDINQYTYGVNSTISKVKVLSDDKIIISGGFTIIGSLQTGFLVNYLAKLNSDGFVDKSFRPDPNDTVTDIEVLSDGKIFIIGGFSSISGNISRYMARLNPSGTFDSNFTAPILSRGSFGIVMNKVLQSLSGHIFVSGRFDVASGVTTGGLIKINESMSSFNKNYLIKGKSLGFDGEIEIDGGIVLNSLQSLAIDTRSYGADNVIIQAYGIEETA